MTPTEDDVRLAKAWAACQDPPVTVTVYGDTNKFRLNLWDGSDDDWIPNVMASIYSTEDAAWSALATALAPVIASVRPVIEEPAYRKAAAVAHRVFDKHYPLAKESEYHDGATDAADRIESLIEALTAPTAKETT